VNFETVTTAADVTDLHIDFAPSTHIFSGIGETFINLKWLEITEQSIKFVERSDFAGLTQLDTLSLNWNLIEFLPENVFWDLPNLDYLDLQDNKIKKLPENIFKNLKKLEVIHLGDNEIDHLPKDLFANNLEIIWIDARGNPLKVIYVDFTALKSLDWLHLGNANCINYDAVSAFEVQKAQRFINQNCTKTT
jgi:Leucine-rich repeat (LRR) protein